MKIVWKQSLCGSIVLLHSGLQGSNITSPEKGFPGGSAGKESACYAGDLGSIPGLGSPLRKGLATHSSILACRIPMDRGAWWVQSMGSQRVGYDWATKHSSTERSTLTTLFLREYLLKFSFFLILLSAVVAFVICFISISCNQNGNKRRKLVWSLTLSTKTLTSSRYLVSDN